MEGEIESRRQFLVTCTWVASALAAESLAGLSCSGAATSTGPTPVAGGNCAASGSNPAVIAASDGHTHSAPAVPGTDVTTGSAKTYTLGTTGTHSHTFTVSASNFTTLRGNQGIALTTDTDSTGHTHEVVLNCVGSTGGGSTGGGGGW